jgi:uncharacterized YccA/Bax inhibitor family protein
MQGSRSPMASEPSAEKSARLTMALSRVARKAGLLTLFVVATAGLTLGGSRNSRDFALAVSSIGGLVLSVLFFLAVITMYRKSWAPITAPVMALLVGVFIAAYSLGPWGRYTDTACLLLGMSFGSPLLVLGTHLLGLVEVRHWTNWLHVSSICWACGAYLVSAWVAFFVANVPLIDSGSFGLVLFMALVPAVILVRQLVGIHHKAESGAPEFLEWYEALLLLISPLLYFTVLFKLFNTCLVPFCGMETY